MNEGAAVQLGPGLPQLSLGIHHDRPVPGYRLLKRLARDQKKANPLRPSLHHNLVAAVKEHQ